MSTLCEYFENEDEIFIIMKKFNQDPSKDKYPTFSICFEGAEFHWHHDLNIFNAYGLNATQYELMLKGEPAMKYKRIMKSNAYKYKKTPVHLINGSYKNFDSFHLKLNDFMSESKFVTEESSNDSYYVYQNSNGVDIDAPMYLTYQTADHICYSRITDDSIDSIRKFELLTLNSAIMGQDVYNKTNIQIFIHYPEQLMYSLSKPKYTASFPYFLSILKQSNGKAFHILEFQISQVKTLRKRYDSNPPCNKNILDYDKFLKRQYIDHLNCVPIYWKSQFSDIELKDDYEDCTSFEDLKKSYHGLQNIANFIDRNEKPCDEMMILSVDFIDIHPNPSPKDVSIKFSYEHKIYEEILYNKKYNFDSFCNTLGGFCTYKRCSS